MTCEAFLLTKEVAVFRGSRSEVSPSESDDSESTLFFFRSELEIALVLVFREDLVLRLDKLAALDTP
jgi:hypothetical protein